MKSIFKTSLFLMLAMVLSVSIFAQEKRASPAKSYEGVVGEAKIMVNYSSPAVKGRTLWGDLVPYDKVWRAGANEATTFETSKDIMVGDSKLPAGKYALFIIPTKENWTFLFNSDPNQWGSMKYDSAKDVAKVVVTPTMVDEMAERLEYMVVEDGLVFKWGKAMAKVDIK
jgi:hypothetical protein